MASHAQSSSAATRRQAFADHVVEVMSAGGAAQVEAKRMFGGHGLFLHGLMFGIILNETLYFKADDETRERFTSRGLAPFQYEAKGRGRTSLSYYEAPPEVHDEPDHMAQWARLGHECAVRQHDAKRKRPRTRVKEGEGARRGAAKAEALADLPNLGPKSAEVLAKAGIKTPAQLRKLGSVQAYVRAKAKSPRASLNLLWALEGALTGRDWKTVADKDRASLLMALEDVQQRTQG